MASTGSMGKLVARFGGKSLSDIDQVRAAADEVADLIAQGWSVVVVVASMKSVSEQLRSFSSLITADPDSREMDILLSSGDQISAALVALALQSKGIQAMALTASMAGIQTDEQYGIATIRNIDTRIVEKLLKQNIVPVLTGSHGVSRQGEIATFGKGGADLLAVSLAEAIHADRLDFLTDVDGVYAQDPKADGKARPINFINHKEMMVKSVEGASVVHPRALELAIARRRSIIVRSMGSAGTLLDSAEVGKKLINLPVKNPVLPAVNADTAVA